MNAPICDAGMALLEELEDFIDHAYPDPLSPLGKELQRRGLWRKYLKAAFPLTDGLEAFDGAPWTIGFGFTKNVKQGDKMTRQTATRRLYREMDLEYVQPIRAACTVEPNENQLAAMTVLAWNIGIAGFLKSTVLKCHNRGDFAAAARAFGLWNKSRGKVVDALTGRRAAEAALYLKPAPQADDEVQPAMMPQQVEPESSMLRSPIVAGSSGIGALTVAAEGARSVSDIRESLGDWLPYVLGAAVIGLAGFLIWQRVRQRAGGWA